MKAKDIQLFAPVKVGKTIWTVLAINGNKALIKSPASSVKRWVALNRIKKNGG